MLNDGKWLRMEVFTGITVKNTLLSLGILIAIAGFVFGVRYERSRLDRIVWDEREFHMVGIGNIPGHDDVYIPVYREKK